LQRRVVSARRLGEAPPDAHAGPSAAAGARCAPSPRRGAARRRASPPRRRSVTPPAYDPSQRWFRLTRSPPARSQHHALART
jgi:hypothetical protein